MTLLRRDAYPPQPERNEQSAAYQVTVDALSAGIDGIDAAYGDDIYQHVAVFPAAAPNGTVLAFIHGGRWTYGYKESMAFMAPPLNAAGVTLVAVGHRLAPATRFPAMFDDVADAIAWTAANVADHGGDAARIFVGGHSSGGHLTALLAVRHDWQGPRGLAADVVRGAMPISGVYDITDAAWPMEGRCPPLADDDDGRAVSPHFLVETAPPHLVAWGSDDYDFLIPQAKEYADALAAAGVEVARLEMAGRTHFTAHCEAAGAGGEWTDRAIAWMAAH